MPDPRCNGKDWVRPLKEIDVYRRYFQLGSLASSGVAIDGIAQASPAVGGSSLTTSQRKSLVPELGRRLRSLGGLGSNAYGIGGDATDNGRGMVLGNPHFPWAGAERLYQSHLTIPGKADVSGAALYGVPAVLIGHTRGLAWSHTVATAWRFTPFEIKLVPGDPHAYLLDGQVRRMKETRVTVKALVNGRLEDRSRTLYETVHGPMFTSLLGLPLFPWTPTAGFALGDVNANNFRYLNHFIKTNQAQSVREYHAIQERYQGIPWVNSLAADSRGEAYYSMNGAIPNVTNAKASQCQTTLGPVTGGVLGLPVPDGSRSACSWGRDPGAADEGLLPNSRIPYRFRRDYVHNGNDSHWLANPSAPLEGFDRIIGIERAEVTPRTRLGLVMMRDRLAGRDGLPGRRFNLSILERVALGNRQYLGELWRDRIVGICRANPTINGVDVREACDVLARWNLRDDLDAPGALLFRRFAARAYPATQSLPTGTGGSAEIGDRGFSEPFDVNRPVDTPTGLQDSNKVRSALASAVTDLRGAGLPLNTSLRRVQKDRAAGTPIHGGPGGLGVFQAISASWNGKGLSPVDHGSSFIMAARFQGGACPARSSTFVTYGQSENRNSPHRTDYTRAFSAKRWNHPPFCPSEVLADPTIATTTYVGNSCTPRGGLRAAGVSRARGGGVRIGLRRARRARVRVDLLRVTRRGLRRVRTFRRTKSFRVRNLRAGTYVARYRIKSANGRTDERRRGFRVRAGRVRRTTTFFRTGCGFVQRLSLASPVTRARRPRLTFRLDRTARVSLRILRGKRTVKRVKLKTRRGERTYSVRLPKLRRGSYRVRLGAVSPGRKRARSTLRFIRR